MEDKIKLILEESQATLNNVIRHDCKTLGLIAEIIIKALKSSHKIILFGNGGSAADAQHIAAELVGRFKIDRKALAAIALNTNTSVVTCLANDFGFDEVFKRQIEALGTKGDVAIGISTSGNSRNVIKAIVLAKKMRLKTIAFTGGTGGKLAKICDIAFVVKSNNTPHIQETHITSAHAICELVEDKMTRGRK